jgi:hypothetical protein
VQSIFLKETRGKETSACPGGGQQVAENGGNERAVPSVVSILDSWLNKFRVLHGQNRRFDTQVWRLIPLTD